MEMDLESVVRRFQEDGFVVVEDVVCDLERAKAGLREVLERGASSSTKGGVLDVFWEQWKLEVTLENEKYALICRALLKETYAMRSGDFWHPHEGVDGDVHFHVDRVAHRAGGAGGDRALSPHLDCNPFDMYPEGRRWRPLQCLLSLQGGLEANEGGFECVKGFHKEFHSYPFQKNAGHGIDFYAIREPDLLKRFQHVKVPAGAALFWDRRIPHANARRNDSIARQVIYGGFLPRGPKVNTDYAKDQRRRSRTGEPQPDFWTKATQQQHETKGLTDDYLASLSPHAKHLLGILNEEEEDFMLGSPPLEQQNRAP